MDNLLPCPFCGGEPYTDIETALIFGRETGDKYAIACRNCEAYNPKGGETMDEDLESWNTRYTKLPKEPSLQLIADLYFKGDIDMAIGNSAITEEFTQDYKKAISNL